MLVKFSGAKSVRTVSKFNKRKRKFCVVFTYSLKPAHEIRKFYVAVKQQQLQNGQKNVMSIQKLLFCLYKPIALLPFWLLSPLLLLKHLIVVIQEFCKLPWQNQEKRL